MDDCLHVLETHPDALPSDRQIIWWAKLGFIMEEAGVQLLSDDPDSTTSFANSKTRYTIKAFNNQLTQWKKDIPEELFTSKSISLSTWLAFLTSTQFPWHIPTMLSIFLSTKVP